MQDPRDTLKTLGESDDRRAVSPVIGVILMVAITVILAAVIATFVLGLGEQVSDTTPNANFQADFAAENDSADIVTIQHQSGDRIGLDELDLGGSIDYLGNESNLISNFAGADGEISAGDSFTINRTTIDNTTATEGATIDIIFDSGDTSSILRTFEVPQNYSDT